MEDVIDEMEIGFGKIGQPLRVALLGKMGGPALDSVMAILGKEETMLRIANAITLNS
jgi:glutamyl-tRNA synthetase